MMPQADPALAPAFARERWPCGALAIGLRLLA
jgi:hypothetical protein